MPSSNQQCDIEKQCKIDLAQYEVVQSSEIVFPNFSLLKRLGRGSYGMVVQCYFRGRIAAAKLLKTNIDYVHNEVNNSKFFNNLIYYRQKFCINLNIKILLNFMLHLKVNIVA